jgi:Zn-dependent protease
MGNFIKNNAMTIVLVLILAMNSIRHSDFFTDPLGWFIQMLLIVPGVIIGITIHEYAHALAAYKLGDMTPKYQKRVSLNPIRHIDPIGFVALLLIGFGWGKPVQVNPYAFRKPRRANLITDVAGIATNFVFAFIFMGLTYLFIRTVGANVTGITGSASLTGFLSSVQYLDGTLAHTFVFYVGLVLYYVIWMNLVLMIFNLLPVPPLDGFGIVTEIFNLRGKPIYDKIYMMGFPILIILIIFNIPSIVISPAIRGIFKFFEIIFF